MITTKMDDVLLSETRMAGSDVEQLLDEARQGQLEPLGQLLQLYRNYLTILATTQLDRRLRRAHERVGPGAGDDAGGPSRFWEIPRGHRTGVPGLVASDPDQLPAPCRGDASSRRRGGTCAARFPSTRQDWPWIARPPTLRTRWPIPVLRRVPRRGSASARWLWRINSPSSGRSIAT